MAEQLAFHLPARAALGRQDFLISPANSDAVSAVDDWAGWPGRKLILMGPTGSGKTHLAHVWAQAAGARILKVADLAGVLQSPLPGGACVVIEDADTMSSKDEELRLLGLHNLLQEVGGWLMVTARAPVGDWGLHLPDLLSRMQAAGVARLDPPDDSLFSGVLVKLFDDRQLQVDPAVIEYIVQRVERSFASAQTAVEAIDRAALLEKRAITRPFVAEILRKTWQDAF